MSNFQQVENLLIRYRGKTIDVKTISGGVYEGIVSDVSNDYVVLKIKSVAGEDNQVIVLLHSIESILPRGS